MEAKLLLDAKARLGEGPSWHAEQGILLWVDIDGHQVHLFNPKTREDRSIDVGQQVGAVVPCASGGAVMAAKHGFFKLDLVTGETEQIFDPEEHLPANRFNDGKCDPAGRFWAGTMLNRNHSVGALYCMDKDWSVIKVLDQIQISNGLDWSPDHQTMYYIDSPTRQVLAFDYDLSSGQISGKRTVIHMPDGHGEPDGMTVDAEGMLWIAEWNGYKVGRWNPASGELLDVVNVPVAKVSSCIFGGDRLDELYITTASVDLSAEDRVSQPLAGGLFIVKPGVQGTRTYTFAG
ncbi:MAG: hypothetical protein JWN30_1808 [Bacilli bacterium]|nr:hypothetical protein [Bacilli bacterium]